MTNSSAQTPDSATVAFDRLAKAKYFAFGGIGRAATISQGQQDFAVILKRSTALQDFEKIFASGNPQGKAYALEGIRRLKPERFQHLAETLRTSTQDVETVQGCEMQREPLGDVVRQIEAGKFAPTTQEKPE